MLNNTEVFIIACFFAFVLFGASAFVDHSAMLDFMSGWLDIYLKQLSKL